MRRSLPLFALLLLLPLLLPSPTLSSSSSSLSFTVPILFNTDGGPQLAMSDLLSAYLLLQPNVSMTLTKSPQVAAVISAVTSQAADFGVLSTGLTASQALAYPTLTMFPAMCFAVVPIYRIDALGSQAPQLILNRATLAKIYLGLITWWNDSAIAATNPAQVMPAQRITMVLPAAGVATNIVWTTALGKFYAPFNASIPASTTPTWPTSLYYRSTMGVGPTGQSSAVISNDGSLGFAFHNIALQLNNHIAAMINKAGLTVQPSVSSVTFASVELGTTTRTRVTDSMDLTDGTGSSVWPLTVMSFLLIDTAISRSTCHVRAAVVEFWQWFYSSDVATALLATRVYAPVPSIVLTQFNVLEQLSNNILCRGAVAVSGTSTTSRYMAAPIAVSFLSTLFSNLYASQDDSVMWEVQTNTDQLILQQMVRAELDLAFIDPSNIDPVLMWQVMTDSDFLILPAYLTAVVYGVNPSLTSSISIGTNSFTLDWPTLAQVFFGCILHWNDPAILAQNPWLIPLVPAVNITPISITKVVGCGTTAATAPLAISMYATLAAVLQQDPDLPTYACFARVGPLITSAFGTCTSLPSLGFLFTVNEASVPGLVQGLNGAMGIIQNTGDSSLSIIAVNESALGGLGQVVGNSAGETACVQGLVSAFGQGGLGSLLPLAGVDGASGGCYRSTQQLWAVIRSNYMAAASDASGCTRGYDTLRFMQWWYGTTAIDTLLQSKQTLRVTSLSSTVMAAVLATLGQVTCDQETLLVTYPVGWSLASGVKAFVYVVSSMGVVACTALALFVFHYRHHPVIRSASPLFLLLTIGGLLVLFAAGYLLVSEATFASCAAFSWLVNVGMMMTFSPLFAKTWRIYRIFGRRKLTVVALSNKKLLLMVAALMGAEVLIMAVWQGLGQLQPITNDVQTSTTTGSSVAKIANRLLVDEYVQCGVPAGVGQSMFVVVCVEKGLLFVWGALMAFTTRKVSSTFNEAQGITLALYNTCFTVGIIAPIIVVIKAMGDVLDLLLAFALLWMAAFTGCVLFGPKVLTVFSKAEPTAGNNTSVAASSSSSAGYAFLSLAALSSIGVLQGYLAALNRHTKQVEDKISKLRGRHHSEVSTTHGGTTSPPPQKKMQSRYVSNSSVHRPSSRVSIEVERGGGNRYIGGDVGGSSAVASTKREGEGEGKSTAATATVSSPAEAPMGGQDAKSSRSAIQG